jgi:hypothetical protein
MSEASEIEAEIAEEAYRLWEATGRPEGRALDHWLEAEVRVRVQRVPGNGEGVPVPGGGATGRADGQNVRYGLVLRN